MTAPTPPDGAGGTGASGSAGSGADASSGSAGPTQLQQGVIAFLKAASDTTPAIVSYEPSMHKAPSMQLVPHSTTPGAQTLVGAVPICVLPPGVSLPAGVRPAAGVTPIFLPGVLPAGSVVAMGPFAVPNAPTSYYTLQPIKGDAATASTVATPSTGGLAADAIGSGGTGAAH